MEQVLGAGKGKQKGRLNEEVQGAEDKAGELEGFLDFTVVWFTIAASAGALAQWQQSN